MPTNRNPTVRQRRLGRMLRELRMEAGKTLADAAKILDCADSKVSRIESANSGVRSLDLKALMDAYGVADEKTRALLVDLARNGRERGWWSEYETALQPVYADYIALEHSASSLYVVETSLLPGLLQTDAYAEAVIRLQAPEFTDEEVAAQLRVRQERKRVLARMTPLSLWVVITEETLTHLVGTAETMREQLRSLLADMDATNINVQVLPTGSRLNGLLYGPFGILSFPDQAETDIVYSLGLLNTVYHEETTQVRVFTNLFRQLNTDALSVEQSQALIGRVIEEEWSK
ncbi:helix-turn-helix domain-containing protein [Streptomyces sp. NPDC091281]|uniref:helix-turn-helix domain-containing protein n=1 Tax=Streptomyces sp. NPDC091281 TaxID=3365985 RepID=UPI0037F43D43